MIVQPSGDPSRLNRTTITVFPWAFERQVVCHTCRLLCFVGCFVYILPSSPRAKGQQKNKRSGGPERPVWSAAFAEEGWAQDYSIGVGGKEEMLKGVSAKIALLMTWASIFSDCSRGFQHTNRDPTPCRRDMQAYLRATGGGREKDTSLHKRPRTKGSSARPCSTVLARPLLSRSDLSPARRQLAN